MLALELRKLESAGIVQRTEFEGYPLRVESAGLELLPLIAALAAWWKRTTAEPGRAQSAMLRGSGEA